MINRHIKSAAIALVVLTGSATLAAAQSTPGGSTSTPGAPAGSGSSSNGATGSGAAPSGK